MKRNVHFRKPLNPRYQVGTQKTQSTCQAPGFNSGIRTGVHRGERNHRANLMKYHSAGILWVWWILNTVRYFLVRLFISY